MQNCKFIISMQRFRENCRKDQFAYQRKVVLDSATNYSNISLTNYACSPVDIVCAIMPHFNAPHYNANQLLCSRFFGRQGGNKC